MEKFICLHCGEIFDDKDYLETIHIPAEHKDEMRKYNESILENDRLILEDALIAEDKELKRKADKYDQICDTFFMATGIIEDGDSIKYLIEPEEVLNAVLKVIIEGLDSDKHIEAKRKYIRREIC